MNSDNFNKYKVKRLSRESIEAEEILLDSEKLKKSPESEREKIEFPIKKRKVYFLYFLVIIFLFALFIKAIDLQIIKGDRWRSLAEENRIRSYPIKTLRGIIFDRNNKPLVFNEPIFNLTVVPVDLLGQKNDLPGIIDYLARTVGEPKENIESLIKENTYLSVPIIVKEDISRETALILESKFSDNPAISVEISSQRNYIDGPYFSHLLGYLGKISKEEHENYKNYLIDDYIGKDGIELYYESLLRGDYGEKLVEVDSAGKIKNIFARKEPLAGKNITLSVDSGLQKKLSDEISGALRKLGLSKAAGIAINPANGEVLALVSFPQFDNNRFIQGISEEDFEKIVKNPSKPFLNRVISGIYPPGSTIKPLIASAALKEGIVDQNKIINCLGSITIYNPYYPNIFKTYHDWTAHGPVNITKAIAESCDVYFYTIGGGYGSIQGLGIEKINYYLKQFGLGKITGVDLPGEASGFVPSDIWKKEIKQEDWYIGDTYNVSIGQGDMLVTPLQIALTTAMIANNGTLFKPQIIDKIDKTSVLPQIINNNIVDKEIFGVVKKGMREAVIYGSAKQLNDLSVKVAGKTGTAQSPGGKAPHAWFTVFAPYENPEIVLTILIENGGEGSITALPIAKEVLKWYFSQ